MRVASVVTFAAVASAALPASAGDPGLILIHAGYGTPRAFVVQGRVIEDEGIDRPDAKRSRFRNLVNTVKALETDEITDARVEITIGGVAYPSRTDVDGVWRVEASELAMALKPGNVPIHVRLIDDEDHATDPAIGNIVIVADTPGIAVISDFDDTVVDSRVTDKKRLLVRTLTRNAAQLEPIPGVEIAYRAAQSSGARAFFYVSGSPQNLYERITAFLQLRKIPVGPILLKNFGKDPLLEQEDYKKGQIRRLMKAIPKLRFVLVGDSGEHDPEIYRDIAASFPGRVVGIVIRRVPGADNRDQRFEGMTVVDDYLRTPGVVAKFVEEQHR